MLRNGVAQPDSDDDEVEEPRPAPEIAITGPDSHPPLPNMAPHFEDTDFKPTSPRRAIHSLPDPYNLEPDEPPVTRRKLPLPPDPSPEKLTPRADGSPDPDEPCSSRNMYKSQEQRNKDKSPNNFRRIANVVNKSLHPEKIPAEPVAQLKEEPRDESDEDRCSNGIEEVGFAPALVAGPSQRAIHVREVQRQKMDSNSRVIQPPKHQTEVPCYSARTSSLEKNGTSSSFMSHSDDQQRSRVPQKRPAPSPQPSPSPPPETPAENGHAEHYEDQYQEGEEEDLHAVPEEERTSEERDEPGEGDEVVPGGDEDVPQEAHEEEEEDEDMQEEIESISGDEIEVPEFRASESRSSNSTSSGDNHEQEELYEIIEEAEQPVQYNEEEDDAVEDPQPAPNDNEEDLDEHEDMSGYAVHQNFAPLDEDEGGDEPQQQMEIEPEPPQQPQEESDDDIQIIEPEDLLPPQPGPSTSVRHGRPRKSAPVRNAAAAEAGPSSSASRRGGRGRGRGARRQAVPPPRSPSTPSRSGSRGAPTPHQVARRPLHVAAKRPRRSIEASVPRSSPSASPVAPRRRGRPPKDPAPSSPQPQNRRRAAPQTPRKRKSNLLNVSSALSGSYWQTSGEEESPQGGPRRSRRTPAPQQRAQPVKKVSKRGRKPAARPLAVPSSVPLNPPPVRVPTICSECQKNRPAAAAGGNTGGDGKTDFFIVEKILDHKRTKEGHFYLIKWLGYEEKHNSWEPTSSIIEAASDAGLLHLQQAYDKLAGKTTPPEEWTVVPAALRARNEGTGPQQPYPQAASTTRATSRARTPDHPQTPGSSATQARATDRPTRAAKVPKTYSLRGRGKN